MNTRKVELVMQPYEPHWVGDGLNLIRKPGRLSARLK